MIPLSSWLIYQAKKLHEYQRAKERKTEEKELRERRERIERAREANKRAAETSTGQEDFGPTKVVKADLEWVDSQSFSRS
uniref:Uncharacterized protein n=1 Tax=Ditylenchus dipsaci TaxID=166011 RepID=A0A915D1Y1_9BILA